MNDLGKVLSVEQSANTVELITSSARVLVTFYSPQLVRLRVVFEGEHSEGISVAHPDRAEDTKVSLTDGNPILIETAGMSVQVSRSPLRFDFFNPAGECISQGWPGGTLFSELVEDGRRRVRAVFGRASEEHFYGLGEGQSGPGIDRDGSTRHFWNSHYGWGSGTDLSVPLLLSSRGYGLFFDNSWDAELQIGRMDRSNSVVYTAEGGNLDVYVFYGSDPKSLLREYGSITGFPPMPPRWAFGYMQSTRHFEHPDEIADIGHQLRDRRIPCDAVIFLSTYGEDKGVNDGVGTLNLQPTLFANAAKVLGELREENFHYVFHEYPVIHPRSPAFDEAITGGHLIQPAGGERGVMWNEGQRMLDFSRPETRDWWWDLHSPLVEQGFDGWWLDGGEGPAADTNLSVGSGRALHNVFDLYRQQAFFEGERGSRPNQRPFLLCRSGFAGSQKYGVASWSGDINNTFDVLSAQVPLGLSTALSGIPYWGTDIGGFFHTVPETAELYARWFQFGAFCPIFRSHGHGQYLRGWREHTPWAHGPEIESICRRYAELRQRLLPYNYSLAWEAHQFGTPLMRPLCLEFPDDRNVVDMGSEYLWGPSILVAPVTRGAANHWSVYLPTGTWHDFWTNRTHTGARWIEVESPLDRMPLLIRGGAIIPMGPVIQYDAEAQVDRALELLIYPERDSSFTIYEDDGSTYAYETGARSLTEVRCVVANGTIVISLGSRTGEYSGQAVSRPVVFRVRQGTVPRLVNLTGSGRIARYGDRGQVGSTEVGWWYEDGFVCVATIQQRDALELMIST